MGGARCDHTLASVKMNTITHYDPKQPVGVHLGMWSPPDVLPGQEIIN